MDFVCFGEIVLEVKARSSTGPADHAQVISYLASSKLHVALLLNFGGDRLEHKRFVRSQACNEIVSALSAALVIQSCSHGFLNRADRPQRQRGDRQRRVRCR